MSMLTTKTVIFSEKITIQMQVLMTRNDYISYMKWRCVSLRREIDQESTIQSNDLKRKIN